MKKFVSLFLVLFMLIPMMTIGINATTETASSTVDDAMFVHYDFSEDSYYTAGTVPVFKNLARTNGQNASQGRLIPNSSKLIWDKANGTLECGVNGTAGSPYMEKNLLDTVMPTAESLTVFARFKLDSDVAEATDTDIYYRLAAQGTSTSYMRIDFVDKASTNDVFIVWFNGTQYLFTGITYSDVHSGFVNIAVVVYQDDSGNFLVKMYAVAKDTCLKLTSNKADTSFGKTLNLASIDTSTSVHNGKLYLIGLQTLGVIMDDFRMYTAAFSMNDLYSISVNLFGASAEDALFAHYDLSASNETGTTRMFTNLVNGGTIGSAGALNATDANVIWDAENGTLENNGAETSPWLHNNYLGSYIESAVELTVFTRFKLDESLTAATETATNYVLAKKGGFEVRFQDKVDTDEDVFWIPLAVNGSSTETNFIFSGISFEDLQRGYVNVALVIYKG